jgi:hypothetical protein
MVEWLEVYVPAASASLALVAKRRNTDVRAPLGSPKSTSCLGPNTVDYTKLAVSEREQAPQKHCCEEAGLYSTLPAHELSAPPD